AEELVGAEIVSNGGEYTPVRVWNGAAGTRIEVRHLFFNTPVRRKFLRTPGTEMGHICEIFTRAALARPGLHLTLRHNNKEVYEVAATTRPPRPLRLVFGPEGKDPVFPDRRFPGTGSPVRLRADPACERGNAK